MGLEGAHGLEAAGVAVLRCAVQHYAWGKQGAHSTVAQLTQQPIKEDLPYAEMWMGTHPSGPSRLETSGQLLSDWLKENPQMLGDQLTAQYSQFAQEGQLPFLFKVLSIAKALSIQAHPDKELARELYKQNKLPDDNHKPELAVALTPMEALCSFRKLSEISNFLETVPELRAVIGEEIAGMVMLCC